MASPLKQFPNDSDQYREHHSTSKSNVHTVCRDLKGCVRTLPWLHHRFTRHIVGKMIDQGPCHVRGMPKARSEKLLEAGHA